MSKIKKLFIDLESDTNLEVFCCEEGKIVVLIEDYQGKHFIELDISTSIAFSKELRREINVAKQPF